MGHAKPQYSVVEDDRDSWERTILCGQSRQVFCHSFKFGSFDVKKAKTPSTSDKDKIH